MACGTKDCFVSPVGCGKMRTRIVFVGCVDMSRMLLEAALDAEANVVGVVTRESSPGNADFTALDDIAERQSIPVHFTKNANSASTAEWIAGKKPDIVFCFGWSQLLGAKILGIPPLGVMGYHPALLPMNRGRHPIIWALVLGLEVTGSTFFLMDEGADSGGIVSQREVPIEIDDDAGALYRRLGGVAVDQLRELLPRIDDDRLRPTPQKAGAANTWRKRTVDDGRVDWRMPAAGVYNLVRALRPPYPGATTLRNGEDRKIWKVAVFEGTVPQNIEPGRVLSVEGTTLVVKCGAGAIQILEHELGEIPGVGAYL